MANRHLKMAAQTNLESQFTVMTNLILHHYAQSPVAEKVRTVLGIKGLNWQSVDIPRIPPKPDLMPLTGGYRRTPTLQIGADIYCDSQCILQELECRFPGPDSGKGATAALAWGLGRWCDGPFFTTMIKLVLSASADTIPQDFAKDRGRLYLGEQSDLHEIAKDIPHLLSQIQGQLAWIDHQAAIGDDFLSGSEAGLVDAYCYYLIWFLRGRWIGGPDLLQNFPALEAWENRVQAVGHGNSEEITSQAALDIAAAVEPATEANIDTDDPQGFAKGDIVAVVPDEDGGDPVVVGKLQVLTRERITLLRQDKRVNSVCVHFPRVGYRVSSI